MGIFSKPVHRAVNIRRNVLNRDFVYSSFSLIVLALFAIGGVYLHTRFGGAMQPLQIPTISSFSFSGCIALLVFPVWIVVILLVLAIWIVFFFASSYMPIIPAIMLSLGFIFSSSLQYVQHWDQVVVLRAGKYKKTRGAGLFFLLPLFDRIAAFVDTRIRATDFNVEKTLTGDTVPVDVDALAFWMVWDAKQAVLEVENFLEAVTLSAQTALRDAIGKNNLTTLLSDREKFGNEIQKILDAKTNPWGISILSVEITDIIIPAELEDAMSKQAQAEREKEARVILGSAEVEIAAKFEKAARIYENNSVALQLRAMNMVYEGIRDKGSLMILPSSALDSMNLGTVMGSAAMQDILKKTPGKADGKSGKGKPEK